MAIELTVTIKDEEGKKLSRPFLLYESFRLEENDPTIDKCVKELLEEFKGIPDDVKIKATMVLR